MTQSSAAAPPKFSRPSRKSSAEPAGLDAFAARAPGTLVVLNPDAEDEARETLGMSVRFTPEEKRALVRLAKADGRSQHRILQRLLRPVLLAAERELGDA